MALTLTALIQEARNLLGDLSVGSYYFSDVQVTSWINQCLRELSIHFPRITTYTISTVAGTREYDLLIPHTGIVSVEYPTGETPPVFLKRRSYTHPLFYLQDGYYDFLKTTDADSLNPPQLLISESPAGVATVTLKVLLEHDALALGADETTVQDRHCHLIALFVRWKGWEEISMHEGMYPGPLISLTGTPELNAHKAEEAYRKTLAEALAAETESAISPWRVDKFDGRY